MEYMEFVKRVRAKARIETLHDAEVAVKATLATLGERLDEKDVRSLGAQIPSELKAFLSGRHRFSRFSLEEYYNRVSARADMGYPEAVERSRAVMSVMREAITEGLVEKILDQLPPDFRELFGEEPQGPLSPSQSR
ncbi:MAG: DUF2267 domain-containing protein [Chitinispirillaceae bacterium]